MAPLDQWEINEIVVKILQELSATPYSCSSLTQLTSGTTNFVFRGTLTSPVSLCDDIKEGIEAPISSTVIIKYSTGFAAVNKDFPIDASRCVNTSFAIICYEDKNEENYTNKHKYRLLKNPCSML